MGPWNIYQTFYGQMVNHSKHNLKVKQAAVEINMNTTRMTNEKSLHVRGIGINVLIQIFAQHYFDLTHGPSAHLNRVARCKEGGSDKER